jgi:bacterioferritin-associated ferredoxin
LDYFVAAAKHLFFHFATLAPPNTMGSRIEIDRCVCYDVRFETLKRALDERPRTLEEIRSEFGCMDCCGMCRPYIERMLETGETVFHQIILPQDA